MKVTLENFRGFSGVNEIELAPLTIVTGENSSGKSSLLAAVSCTLQSQFPFSPSIFNRPPFELGNYSTIASYRGGRGKKSPHFSLALCLGDEIKGGSYVELDGQPVLHHWWRQIKNDTVTVRASGPNEVHIEFKGQSGNLSIVLPLAETLGSSRVLSQYGILAAIDKADDKKLQQQIYGSREKTSLLLDLDGPVGRSGAIAIAPVRTRPKRTYDQIGEEYRPEGDHIPFQLSRLWSDSSKNAETFRTSLLQFGKDSGLFDKMEVRRLGKKSTLDPFQILLKIGVPQVNLADVGYGVSQVLPLIYECLRATSRNTILIQQPEVHLHPRGQAALGTFLAQVVRDKGLRVVLETHSDYLIDRIRIEIAKKQLKPDSVKILFLERKKSIVHAHSIYCDDLGNVLGAPASYGEFFFKEQRQLVGLE